MNPFFWLLVVAAMVFAWFVMSFMFKPIGRFFMRLFNDAMKEFEEEKEQTEE